jgi:hypothetical protein
MKETGVIFTADSIRAMLREDNPKTQTRRVARPFADNVQIVSWKPTAYLPGKPEGWVVPSPYGVPGDRIWCKETWAALSLYHDPLTRKTRACEGFCIIARRADHVDPRGDGKPLEWRSPIFMPKWASRITLELTEVRVQRLQEISYEDAKAEGLTFDGPRMMSLYGADNERRKAIYDIHGRLAYQPLWDSLNAKRGYPWDSNPWVWAYTFKRVNQ